jgi:hypothetical protein
MKTRGFLGFVGASFLLFAVGSVLTVSAYAGTPPPPPPPPTSNPTPPQTTSPPPVTTTTTPTTTTATTPPSSGSSGSGSKVRVHHKVKQQTQRTHKKKHPANTTPKPVTKATQTPLKPKAIVPVPNTSGSGVPQIAAVAAIVAGALVVLALLALVISVAVMRTRGPRRAGGGNIMIR